MMNNPTKQHFKLCYRFLRKLAGRGYDIVNRYNQGYPYGPKRHMDIFRAAHKAFCDR